MCYLVSVCRPGHHFQGINIRMNYIAWNNVSYRNLMSLFGVHLNFSSNIVKVSALSLLMSSPPVW